MPTPTIRRPMFATLRLLLAVHAAGEISENLLAALLTLEAAARA